jgi:hypothetical protein
MPLVGIGTLPTPFSPASVPLPPETGGRGHTSLRVGGWGESQFRRGAYTVVLFICTYFVHWPHPIIRSMRAVGRIFMLQKRRKRPFFLSSYLVTFPTLHLSCYCYNGSPFSLSYSFSPLQSVVLHVFQKDVIFLLSKLFDDQMYPLAAM